MGEVNLWIVQSGLKIWKIAVIFISMEENKWKVVFSIKSITAIEFICMNLGLVWLDVCFQNLVLCFRQITSTVNLIKLTLLIIYHLKLPKKFKMSKIFWSISDKCPKFFSEKINPVGSYIRITL